MKSGFLIPMVLRSWIKIGLYGKALARHLREIDRVDLVNIEAASDDEWKMSISLIFSHEGRDYELRRDIEKKRHVSRPRNNADFEEVIGLVIDGERISGDRIYSEINQAAPEEISRFFLFDGELLQEYENLLIEQSEQGEKIKHHIEQALGVPALVNGKEDLSALLKEARRLQARDAKKNDDLKSYAEQQRQLEIKLSKLEKENEDLKGQFLAIRQEIDGIDDELKNTEVVQRKKVELEGLKSELKQTDIIIGELADEKRELLKNAWMDVLYASAEPLLKSLKQKRDDIHSAVSKKAVLDKEIKNLVKVAENSICTQCLQPIPESQVQPLRDKLKLLNAESELMIVNMEDATVLTSQIDRLSNIRSAQEGKRILQNLDKKRKSEVQLIRIETKLEEIEDEIRGFDTDQIMRQREKRDRKSGQLANLSRDIDDCRREIDKTEEKLDQNATLISRNAGAQGQQSSIRVNMYQELEQVFLRGIDFLRDALKTERSAGAEQIVALALIDGLNRTARKSGPIVMDTPLGRLDPKHRSNVLKYLPKMADQVVLLVHEGEIHPERDIQNFADRIGARYEIQRKSATESMIVRCD